MAQIPNLQTRQRSFVGHRIRSAAAAAFSLMLALLVGCSSGSDTGGGDNGQSGPKEPGVTQITLPEPREDKLPQLALTDEDFRSAHYSGSGNCSGCHNDNAPDKADRVMFVEEDAGPRDVSINRAWESSMMANATRDPYWHAVVASELHHFPTLTDEINDTCTVCHAPMAVDMARKEGIDWQLFDTGSVEAGDLVQGLYSMNSDDPLFNHGMEGISCTFCHQMADTGVLGEDEGMSGKYRVDFYADPEERPAYGQFEAPAGLYMRQLSEFNPVYSAHISTSESCATCHNLKTSPVDKDGSPVTEVSHFAEQMIYSEWEASAFNVGGEQEASCQDCHMPKLASPMVLASAGGGEPRDNFAEHSFLGANTVMQSMLRDNAETLGIRSDIDFDGAIVRNRAFLQSSADIALQNAERIEDTLSVDVQITNRTGHKLPSGYHSRRVYLNVKVTDASGELVYENGRMNPDGSIAGVSEDVNPKSFETHYDVINSPTQVQVYQAITRDANGDQTHSLLNATGYLKDNRLTPAGFDKNNLPADIGEAIAVHGFAAADTDFNLGSDTVTYRIPVTGAGPFNVQAELRYQSLSFGALKDLFSESDQVDQVNRFRIMYEKAALRDELLASDTLSLP